VTPDERHWCDTFVRAQTLLTVDDDALTDDNDLNDLEAIAAVLPQVKEFTAAGDTPEQLAIHRLACCTERLLLTWARPDRQAVKDWLLARGELLDLRLAGNV
jgi:hypothetical protein